MASRRVILCDSARLTSGRREWREAESTRLKLTTRGGDVRLRLEHLTNRLEQSLPEVAVDLLELAAYVYAADRAVSRGSATTVDYGRRWRRRLRFEVPVRRPDVWNQPHVMEALREVLYLLSQDRCEFAFSQMIDPPPVQSYMFGSCADAVAGAFQCVLLFSGGVDSLAGPTLEVVLGSRKVALVSHRPSNAVFSRQRDLVTLMAEMVPSTLRPLHAAVEVNKGKRRDRCHTQQYRSFLFASVAAVVAKGLGLSGLRFYENGVTSLNLPVSPQVIGSRVSRSTHPQVLRAMARFYAALFGEEFAVDNPLQPKTKEEVFRVIRSAGCGSLCARTCSCIHTRESTAELPHCGRCSQCVDRRLNALAAGLTEEEDPASGYASDVITGARTGRDFALTESYVRTALRMTQYQSPKELLRDYGELGDVLKHMDMPPQQAARAVFEMCRRHGHAIRRVLAEQVARHATRVVDRDYPAHCLLAVAAGRGPSASDAPRRTRASAAPDLVMDEKTFSAWCRGRQVPLGNGRPFWLLSHLSRCLGQFVSHDELIDEVWDGRRVTGNAVHQAVLAVRRAFARKRVTCVRINSEKGYYRVLLSSG